jgi:hypothetical protein
MEGVNQNFEGVKNSSFCFVERERERERERDCFLPARNKLSIQL